MTETVPDDEPVWRIGLRGALSALVGADREPRPAVLRLPIVAGLLASLALGACSTGPTSSIDEPDLDRYGPATDADPWGPYIRAAADRFEVPEIYVRAVMKMESGGRTMLNGRPITSHAGARGLMQVMPATFAELRAKHGLGPNIHDPWTNIQAGTAYIGEMVELYGAPGFLAAYNCGPGCYGEYLAGRRALPRETRAYLATGQRLIAGARPRSMVAVASAPGLAADLPMPPRRPAVKVQASMVLAASPLEASTSPTSFVSEAGWGVQVGAFLTPAASGQAAERARRLSRDLQGAQLQVSEVTTSAGRLYRVRLIGLNEQVAARACQQLSENGAACVTVRET